MLDPNRPEISPAPQYTVSSSGAIPHPSSLTLHPSEHWRKSEVLPVAPWKVQRWQGDDYEDDDDGVVIEEPFELRLNGNSLAVIMRTPGPSLESDRELAMGFMLAEGVITDPSQVAAFSRVRDADGLPAENVLNVKLKAADSEQASANRHRLTGISGQPSEFDPPPSEADSHPSSFILHPSEPHPSSLIPHTSEESQHSALSTQHSANQHFERRFVVGSSCGLCGKNSIVEACRRLPPLEKDSFRVAPEVLYSLPETLRASQAVFDRTGGLHAAGLFDASGQLVMLREDIGRHNAVDRLLGRMALDRAFPLPGYILQVSGRLSYDLILKALVARVPVISAVSAPSSLALQLAEEANLTVVGFLRGRHMNVYTHSWRIEMKI
jgi:FdhD protein